MLLALITAMLSTPAHAGVFQHKTMHGDWPELQVQRDFVLPRGWFVLGVDFDRKVSTGMRKANGRVVPFRNAASVHHAEMVVGMSVSGRRTTS